MQRQHVRGLFNLIKNVGALGHVILLVFLIGVYFHTSGSFNDSTSPAAPPVERVVYVNQPAAPQPPPVQYQAPPQTAPPVQYQPPPPQVVYEPPPAAPAAPVYQPPPAPPVAVEPAVAYQPPAQEYAAPAAAPAPPKKKKKKGEPIDKSQDRPINDPHGLSFRMKDISNPEIFAGEISEGCSAIMKTGKWASYEQSGFERAVMIDGHEKDVSDPEDPAYPDMFPPWYIWRRQNYTGKWGSEAGCEIHRYTKPELAQCLGSGQQTVYIVGGERGRQLQKAMVVYLNGHEWGFKDKEHYHHANTTVEGVAETVFYWSQQFKEVAKNEQGSGLMANVKMALSEATTFDNHGNLVIIEEHLLHTLGELEEKVHEIEDPAEYISTKITRSFRGSVLPSILMAMKKRPTLHVFVLAAQYPQKDKKLQPLLVKLVDEYNKQLKDAIDKITALGYNGILFVDVTRDMARSPAGVNLIPTGLELAWPCKKYGTCGMKNVAAHEAMMDVIFNVYCRGLNRNYGPNICCQ